MGIKSIALGVSALVLSTSVNAALIERLGGLAYYDDVADLTWLADANAAGTKMTWSDANAWAAGYSVGGVDGWRLADTLQPDASCSIQSGTVSYGYNCTGSEMGSLFYGALGNTSGSLTNTGDFTNVQSGGYWSASEYAPDTSIAWYFGKGDGLQYINYKTYNYYAWAVQSGDVSAASVVPIPAAVWLFGSGLLGLVGMARRKKA